MYKNCGMVRRLKKILGLNLLASFLHVSASELSAYIASPKSIPEIILRRLAFLTKLTDILGGAYNNLGIRQWFLRQRTQLNGRSPAEMLKENWNPEDHDPRSVLELARSINI